MLEVITPEEALRLIEREFSVRRTPAETISWEQALGRVLAEPVTAAEFVPDFHRSTVDGYAVRARDTFGCSDSLPAVLEQRGRVEMGRGAGEPLKPDTCVQVPTGGAIPEGTDAVVMVEYSEDFGDGTVGMLRPAAPGQNLIFRGDDVKPGQEVLPAGHRLEPHDIGTLAALGVTRVAVRKPPVVGILSTGDELVPADRTPGEGQVRDVNGAMLSAAVTAWGGVPRCGGILADREELLLETVSRMAEECDLLLLSGGSSVGEKDATCRVMERLGEVLFHGIAMKPGKPTILGRVKDIPVLGLPGHPAAACFTAHLFARPLIAGLTGRRLRGYPVKAVLAEPVPANHGRAQYNGVRLSRERGVLTARPIRGKSGLITVLAAAEGYLCVPRDCEGLPAGAEVEVTLYSMD